MAEVIRTKKGYIDSIKAKNAEGQDVVIFGAQPTGLFNTLLSTFAFGGDPRSQVTVKSAFNVKGSRDGTNTLLVIKSASERGGEWKVRVKETPEQLRSVFKEAAVENKFPAVEETLGARIFQKLFRRPYYKPVTPA